MSKEPVYLSKEEFNKIPSNHIMISQWNSGLLTERLDLLMSDPEFNNLHLKTNSDILDEVLDEVEADNFTIIGLIDGELMRIGFRDFTEKVSMSMTLGEFSNRWHMSDRSCEIMGLNPYCLNEGSDRERTISISQRQAEALGIGDGEFQARCKK